MKQALTKCLFALVLTLGIFSLSDSALAYARCRVVPGHYAHGVWRPAHKVCHAYGHHCRFVKGHWRHGHWIPSHKVCW